MILPTNFHTPVLLSQVINSLRIKKNKKYIDATIGGGGYGLEILKRDGVVLGIDQDREAIEYVKEKLEGREWKLAERKNLYLVHANFKDLKQIALSNGFTKVAGIIFDLGMSSYQLEGSGRGFSYLRDEPLDMRMDIRQKITAADLLNNLSTETLYEIFTKYAEELHSRAVAEAIVRTRTIKGRITRTSELAKVVDALVDRIYSKASKFNKLKILHGTKARIFQALRIVVNNELENLLKGLTQAIDLLETGGRIVILSYHSLEDRQAKLIFKKEVNQGKLKILNSNLWRADRTESAQNPKAKSAKLRIAEKFA